MADDVGPVLLSVALHLPKQSRRGFFGHEVSYQRALTEAAQRRGIASAVIVPFETDADIPGLVTLGGGTAWVDGFRKHLSNYDQERVTVLFYEGDLDTLRFAAHLAQLHPEVVFVVNLFGKDANLAVPHLSERSSQRGLHLQRIERPAAEQSPSDSIHGDAPANVLVYADTARRAVLARTLGLQNVMTWPLYSVLDVRSAEPHHPSQGPCRVVIPIAGRQVTRQLVYEVACVVELCDRYGAPGQRFDWHVFGGGYDSNWRRRSRARRMARLRSLGVRFDPDGLSGDSYASVLTQADVIWLPQRGSYTTQSSGKAADALVTGTPVIAPNGSFPAQEMDRWVPGAPAYTGVREAVEILLRAPALLPPLRDAIGQRLDEIRWWYSPERAVDEILDASNRVHDRLAPSGGRESIAVDSPRPPAPPERHMAPESRGAWVRRVAESRLAHLKASFIEAWVRLITVIRIR